MLKKINKRKKFQSVYTNCFDHNYRQNSDNNDDDNDDNNKNDETRLYPIRTLM